MSGQNRSSFGLQDHKFIKPLLTGNFSSICVKAVSLVEGNPSHGSTAAVGSTGVRKQQHREHQSLSLSRVALRACKPTPLKVFRAEMMEEQKRQTHTLAYAHVHAHIPRTCSKTHTCVHTYLCAQIHTQTHRVTCTSTSTHANAHAHARTHACIQP
jgi:hypothetical protein